MMSFLVSGGSIPGTVACMMQDVYYDSVIVV